VSQSLKHETADALAVIILENVIGLLREDEIKDALECFHESIMEALEQYDRARMAEMSVSRN
jgi:hypothetical protein